MTARRLMIAGNLLIGDPGISRMSADVLRAWQRDKVKALGEALDLGREKGAELCIVPCGLLAEGFVAQSLLEATMSELGSHEVPVMWFPLAQEATDLEARVEVPDSVVIRRGGDEETVEGIRISRGVSGTELVFEAAEGAVTRGVGFLEPVGFGFQRESGFLLVDLDDGKVAGIEQVPCAVHPFVSVSADIGGGKSGAEMLSAIRSAIEGLSETCCVRLVLSGDVGISDYFNINDLTEVLGKRFFYAEVDDECSVELDEAELEGDVSLFAEFARIASSDETLSATERARILRCGWNALNGKRLAE